MSLNIWLLLSSGKAVLKWTSESVPAEDWAENTLQMWLCFLAHCFHFDFSLHYVIADQILGSNFAILHRKKMKEGANN